MRGRVQRWIGIATLACALAACAAPTPQPAQQSVATATREAGAALPAAQPQPPTSATPDLRKLAPRTGGPLPAQVLDGPVKIDRSCASDADCTVKDVGSCCGVSPACVNVDSPTDPKAVQAQCAKKGMASICGFKPIDHCQCTQGQCRAVVMMTDAQ